MLRDVHDIASLLDALLGYDFVMFELLPVIVPIEQRERVNLNSRLPTLWSPEKATTEASLRAITCISLFQEQLLFHAIL